MTTLLPASRRTADPAAGSVRGPVLVALSTAAVGIPVALLWAVLAPGEVSRVIEGEVSEPLVGENQHRFDALATFVLLMLSAGVLTAVALWMVRELRGPMTLVVAAGGSTLAGVLAVWIGEWLSDLRADGSGAAGQLVEHAPEVASWWVLVAMPLGMTLTYATLTACTTAPDLGRRG